MDLAIHSTHKPKTFTTCNIVQVKHRVSTALQGIKAALLLMVVTIAVCAGVQGMFLVHKCTILWCSSSVAFLQDVRGAWIYLKAPKSASFLLFFRKASEPLCKRARTPWVYPRTPSNHALQREA